MLNSSVIEEELLPFNYVLVVFIMLYIFCLTFHCQGRVCAVIITIPRQLHLYRETRLNIDRIHFIKKTDN